MDTIGSGITTKLTKEDIVKTLELLNNLEAKRFVVLNTVNESFFQFIIVNKKTYILDFPDYESNENHNKSHLLMKILVKHSFRLTGDAVNDESIKEREMVEDVSDDGALIQANCGKDVAFIAELIKELSLTLFEITEADLINIEYMD